MSANDFTRDHLERAEGEVSAAAEVAERRVRRLLDAAFQNGDRAFTKYEALLHERGLGPVIHFIEDRRRQGDRAYHFGFLNHGLIDRAGRQRAKQALAELPEAIQTHAKLIEQTKDLSAARRAAEEREDLWRFEDRSALEMPRARGSKRE